MSENRSGVHGAFFDVDETLISAKSMFDFLSFYLTSNAEGPDTFDELVARFRGLAAAGTAREVINREFYRLFAGETTENLALLGKRWFDDRSARPDFFNEPVTAAYGGFRAAGVATVLISGSFFACLDPLAEHLGADEVYGARLVTQGGVLTGEMAAPLIGEAKAVKLREVVAARGWDAAECVAYGDHASDIPMLSAVGTAVAVGEGLRETAERQGWTVLPLAAAPASAPAATSTAVASTSASTSAPALAPATADPSTAAPAALVEDRTMLLPIVRGPVPAPPVRRPATAPPRPPAPAPVRTRPRPSPGRRTMRILATSAPNQGHFYPMVPLLWALRGAGHDVRVAVAGEFAATAATTGLPVMQLGGEVNIGRLGGSGPAQQGADIQSLVDHVIGYYLPLATRNVAQTVKLVEGWLPDLVIHTGWEFAGPIAAARRGIPTVLHGWGMAQPAQLDAPVTEALADLHRDWDLPERLPAPLKRIDICPPTLQVGRAGADVLPMACVPYSGSAVVPAWLTEPHPGRRVCVTLGNAPIKGDHDNVMRTVRAALSHVDAQVLIATGDHLADVGDLPANMRAVRGLPLSVLLSECDLVIHHGGAGSALATLAHGLPALALPQMCVQYQHADRIAEVGAGLRLHPGQAEAEAIEAAVTGLLSEASSAREVAQSIQGEMRARPRAADVVTFIEAAMGV